MRVYSRLKGMLVDHKDLLLKLEKLERKVDDHDENLKIVFRYLKELVHRETQPARRVGFKRKGEQD